MPASDQNKPLSELFKPAADSWNCEACYVRNNASDNICVSCTTPKPGATVESTAVEPIKTSFGFGNTQPFSFKAPISNTNTGFNFGLTNTEHTSSADSNTIFSNTNFKFGNTSFNSNLNSMSSPPSLGFGLQMNKPNDNKSPQNMFSMNPNSNETKANSFQFGLSRFDFEFPKFGAEEPIKSSNVAEEKVLNEKEEENTSLNESQVEPSNADNIYFQPVVPLPPKIEVKTGEESENVLHSCRARLFRFCDTEWKERGVGEVKILASRDSNRIRLLMRRDTIFKVCLNQSITRDLKLELKDDKKSITWSAIDYSEDTPNPEIFLLRLKNAENAQLFLNAIESAKSSLPSDDTSNTSLETTTQTEPNQIKPNEEKPIPKPSIESNVSSAEDNEIEIVYQKRPDSEEVLKKVEELKLPLNFYDYENMDPCPGCRGCLDEGTPLYSNSETKSTEKSVNETSDSTEESMNSFLDFAFLLNYIYYYLKGLFHSAIAATNISQTDWKSSSSGQQLWANTPTPIFSSPRSPSQDDGMSVGVRTASDYF